MSAPELLAIRALEGRLAHLKQRLARLRAACGAAVAPPLPSVSAQPQLQRWRAGAAAAALLRALSCAATLFGRAVHDADADSSAEGGAGQQLERLAVGLQRLMARHASRAVQQLTLAARHRVGQRRAARLLQQLELVRWPHQALLPAASPAPVDWAAVRLAAVPLLLQPARLAATLAAPLQLRFQFAARSSTAARISDALQLLPPLITAAQQIVASLGFAEKPLLLRLIAQRLVATVIERLRQVLQRDSETAVSQRSVLSIGDTLHAAHRELELVCGYIPRGDEPCLFDCFSPTVLAAWKDGVRANAFSQLATSLKSPLAWALAFPLSEWESLPDSCAIANAAKDFIAVLLSTASRLRYFTLVDYTHGLLAELIHYMVDHMSASANDSVVPSGLAAQLVLMNSAAALAGYLHDWTGRIRRAEANEDSLLDLVVADRGTAQILEDGATHFEELGRLLRKNVLSSCLIALSSSLEPYFGASSPEGSDEKRLIRASIAAQGAELAATITSLGGAETRQSLLRSLCTAVEELIQSRPNVQQLRLLLLPLFSCT